MIICSMGGGFSSTARLPRLLLKEYHKKDIHFVIAVLPNEHPDMWKLCDAVESNLDISITYIAYDKKNKWQYIKKQDRTNKERLFTPLDVFDDVGLLGNSRFDPCSRILKRETLFHYINDMFSGVTLAVGLHSDEVERASSIKENWQNTGFEVIFPLLNKWKFTSEEEQILLREWYGITIELYLLGFEHNNCHGACIKAGQRQWARLWYYYPKIYQEWEDRENSFRLKHGNYTILKKQIKGQHLFITLKEFRMLFLEPYQNEDTFLSSYISELPATLPCVFCSAI